MNVLPAANTQIHDKKSIFDRGNLMLRSSAIAAMAVSIFCISTSAFAESVAVKRILPSCVSKELLDEILQYRSEGDKDGYRQILGTAQCVLLDIGDRVSVIDTGISIATIRWRGIKWYTPIETIK